MDSMEIRRMTRIYGMAVSVGAVIILAWMVTSFASWMKPYDDTDPPGGRSGMDLLTDHGTGCQYLYRSGAITPRMDANGKQMCSRIGG